VQALLPLEQPAIDVGATACCGDCVHADRGEDLWRRLEALAAGGLAGLVTADGQPVAARRQGKRDGAEAAGPGRFDCRGRPLVSTLARVAAGGGRVLLLVADVARRRPLLTRDLPLAYLDAEGLYLHGACLANRLGVAVPATGAEPRLVVADCLTAAATPQLVAAFDQIVFVDPPFDGDTLAAVGAAAGDGASLHFVWGQGEVHFSEQVLTRVYDLDQALRRLWRAAGEDGDLTVALQHEHLAGPLLAEPLVLAAAVRTLREAGLLAPGGGKNLLRPAQGKVDLATSETYRAWRQRFQTKTFLARCLTARL
jgi:hypothetical protein